MGNTIFYQEAKKENAKISWKDILGESFKKHSMKDLEYAMAAGSPYDTASPETMLKKWHKPWVWTRVFLLLGVIGVALYVMYMFLGNNRIDGYCALIVLTCITPITSMILFWELDVARDISVFKLVGYFLLGMVLSFLFEYLLNQYIFNTTAAWQAPFTEEPAKFLAGVVILATIAKKRDIFGCTGIAVGAGVGTGFTLFESLGYVFQVAATGIAEYSMKYGYSVMTGLMNDYDLSYNEALTYVSCWGLDYGFSNSINTIIARSLPTLNAHMLMCVPYIAMLAYNYHETKDWKKSILDRKTLIMLLMSGCFHAFWNSDYNISIVTELIVTAGYLLTNLYVIRFCLRQAVREGNYVSGQGINFGENDNIINAGESGTLNIISIGSVMNGYAWKCHNTVLIGKMSNCEIQFPPDTAGLSRVHCRLRNCGEYWTVCDLGSSYGTRLNGTKLATNTDYKLTPSSILELGSSKIQLKLQ